MQMMHWYNPTTRTEYAAVAQNIGYPLGMLTLYKPYRGARVPEIVEPYPRQAARIEQRLEAPPYQIARVHRRTLLRSEH
jgi:hypothetical protein